MTSKFSKSHNFSKLVLIISKSNVGSAPGGLSIVTSIEVLINLLSKLEVCEDTSEKDVAVSVKPANVKITYVIPNRIIPPLRALLSPIENHLKILRKYSHQRHHLR